MSFGKNFFEVRNACQFKKRFLLNDGEKIDGLTLTKFETIDENNYHASGLFSEAVRISMASFFISTPG